MYRFAIVSGHPERFAVLADTLTERAEGATIVWYHSGAAALEAAADAVPDLIVVDEDLADLSALSFLRRLMAVNAMINTAVASRRAPAQFDEHYEGLGVLVQLPAKPDPAAAKKLIERLQALPAGA